MTEKYADHHCNDCGDDLFQLQGDWICPTCERVEQFTLDSEGQEGESFAL